MPLNNTPLNYSKLSPNYEKIIMNIGSKIPKSVQVKSFEGCYYHKDPCYRITLTNNKAILLRIWEKGMSEGYENQAEIEKSRIFISAYLDENGELSHLPIYGWYQEDDYEKIWNKILTREVTE